MNVFIMPVIIDGGGYSAPLSDNDVKLFIGVWIVLNTVWVATWIITAIKNLVRYRLNKKYYYYHRPALLEIVFDFSMFAMWGVGLLFYLGSIIAKFI